MAWDRSVGYVKKRKNKKQTTVMVANAKFRKRVNDRECKIVKNNLESL
jgi:hypothetical protein